MNCADEPLPLDSSWWLDRNNVSRTFSSCQRQESGGGSICVTTCFDHVKERDIPVRRIQLGSSSMNAEVKIEVFLGKLECSGTNYGPSGPPGPAGESKTLKIWTRSSWKLLEHRASRSAWTSRKADCSKIQRNILRETHDGSRGFQLPQSSTLGLLLFRRSPGRLEPIRALLQGPRHGTRLHRIPRRAEDARRHHSIEET
jgi:hypothetical protein